MQQIRYFGLLATHYFTNFIARHQKAIHGNKSIKKFKCEFCPYVTHTGPYLYEHRTKKHGNRGHVRSIASGGESKGIKDKQFVCSECNGYFSNKGSILHHVCGSKKGKVSTLGVVGLWG